MFYRFFPPSQMTCCAWSTWKTQLNWLFVLSYKILADRLQPNPSSADHSQLGALSGPCTYLSITEPQAASYPLCVCCARSLGHTALRSPASPMLEQAGAAKELPDMGRAESGSGQNHGDPGHCHSVIDTVINTDSQSLKVLIYIVFFLNKTSLAE